MRLAVLGSGSKGNASVLEAGGCRLLIDAGLSARQMCQRLAHLGVDPHSLDGILLSHEHSDHTRGLEVFLRKHRVPIFSTALTREVLADRVGGHCEWRLFQRGEEFSVGTIEVEAFAVPHDAVDPVGFVCRSHEGVRFGVATDLGHVTTLVKESLRGVHGLFLEANYDQQLLEADTKRPWSIKQRIASRHGHLSNKQACELAGALCEDGLEAVVLGHLSGDCKSPEVAARVLLDSPAAACRLTISSQDAPTEWVTATPERRPALAGAGSAQAWLFPVEEAPGNAG